MPAAHTQPAALHDDRPATLRRISPPTLRFIRHYAEMIAAMLLGMGVLWMPAGWALGAVGSSWSQLRTDAPSLLLLGMAITMTAPMIAWMRYRGHGWRANTEMAASMFLPTFAAIALHLTGALQDIDTLLIIEHIAMPLSMLAAMLLRTSEYTHAHEHAAVRAA